ncbi:MAG: PP2C family protein-serine/threonine phosphatase, partial [Geobacteraceae bacterium]|nr:PP2C family protein-serine/threonine phosphatase [Geobacteraceae bacterium]
MLSFASAGHNKPLLFRQGEVACIEIDAEGLILGVMKAVVFENKSIMMLEGDILLLYTDGITEAENHDGEFFGIDRLSRIVAGNHAEPPQKIIDSVLESLSEFCQSRPLQDDISMVVLKVL